MNAPLPTTEPGTPPDAAERRDRQRRLVEALTPLLPAHALLWQSEDTVPYECDGRTA